MAYDIATCGMKMENEAATSALPWLVQQRNHHAVIVKDSQRFLIGHQASYAENGQVVHLDVCYGQILWRLRARMNKKKIFYICRMKEMDVRQGEGITRFLSGQKPRTDNQHSTETINKYKLHRAAKQIRECSDRSDVLPEINQLIITTKSILFQKLFFKKYFSSGIQ